MEGCGFSACRPPRVSKVIQLKRTGISACQRQASAPEATAGRCHGILLPRKQATSNTKTCRSVGPPDSQLTLPGELVLDAFCGSGSTCAAALLTGRKYIGIELDQVYFNHASTRLGRAAERMAAKRPSSRMSFFRVGTRAASAILHAALAA